MTKFQLLVENSTGGMLTTLDVSSRSIVTEGDQKTLQLNLSNGQVLNIPINGTMEDKVNQEP